MAVKVCVVALNAYPAIDPAVPGVMGGVETRAWLFARGLAARPGFKVSFVVRHWQPLRQKTYENVRLILMHDRLYPLRDSLLSRLDTSTRIPRLRHPRLSDLMTIPLVAAQRLVRRRPDPRSPVPFFEKLDTDLFLTFGVQSNSATVIASAQARQLPAVLFLGSDSDLDDRYSEQSDFVSVYHDRAAVCGWILQQADLILCQTDAQQKMLQKRFNRNSQVIRNPIDLDWWDAQIHQPDKIAESLGLSRYALWVGRADAEHKRPQLLLELARKCPVVTFLMIMNPRDDVVEAHIRDNAPANVRIVRQVPFTSMPAIFQKAAVLINTSQLEGFPNTFLQAAATEVPIASLSVEEDFLMHSGGGFCARDDLDSLAEFVQKSWEEPPTPDSAAAARQYLETKYSLDQQITALGDVINQAVAADRSSVS